MWSNSTKEILKRVRMGTVAGLNKESLKKYGLPKKSSTGLTIIGGALATGLFFPFTAYSLRYYWF